MEWGAGMEGWRDGGMEGWRHGGMEAWRETCNINTRRIHLNFGRWSYTGIKIKLVRWAAFIRFK